MATTFTLSRKTYSAALDSTPLVIDEIDYLNYLEKSFADDDSNLALAAGGAVGLGGILGGSYMESNAKNKIINEEIEGLKKNLPGEAPKKSQDLINAEAKFKAEVTDKVREHVNAHKGDIRTNRAARAELKKLNAEKQKLINVVEETHSKAAEKELANIQKKLNKLLGRSERWYDWGNYNSKRDNLINELANRSQELEKARQGAINKINEAYKDRITGAQDKIKDVKVTLKPEQIAARDNYLKLKKQYMDQMREHASKSAGNPERIKLLESRDQGTIEELLKGHEDALKGKGKWLKRAGYGGLALGAGYWGAKKLGLLGGRKQPQQQYYYQ